MLKKSLIFIMILVCSALILSACGAGQSVEPTMDANLLYTMAAQTVVVQLTEAAAKIPSSTATKEPTNTPPPIPTIAIQPTTPPLDAATQTPDAGIPTDASLVTPGALPTDKPPVVEPTTAPIINGDHAYFGYQHPADNSILAPQKKFMLIFGVVNNGTTTWSTGYHWDFLGGTQLSSTSSVSLKKPVPPGQKSEVDISASAPGDHGKFICHWRLVTQAGVPVPGAEVYFSFKVE